MITHIYFDWSRTLARQNSKKTFVDPAVSTAEKVATLYADTLTVLKTLISMGYTLGIISNTSKSPRALKKFMKQIDIDRFFKGAVIYAGSGDLCRKPCKEIFAEALSQDKISPSAALMVGNDYEKDIRGARAAGLKALLVDRERPCSYKEKHIHNLSQLIDLLPEL